MEGRLAWDKPQLTLGTVELPIGLSCQNLPRAVMLGRLGPSVCGGFCSGNQLSVDPLSYRCFSGLL